MKTTLLGALGSLILLNCAATHANPGDDIRKVITHIDSLCKDRKLGPYLDPSDPEYSRKKSITDCAILDLKPFNKDVLLNTSEAKFAYSIQLPAPLSEPRVSRNRFVRAVDYFDALCEQEAGEYLFKSVENVDGVRLTRTPPKLSRQGDLGPLGSESVYGQYEEPEGSLLGSAPSYRFVERPIRSDEQARFPAALYLRIGVGAERTAANLLGLDKSPIATMSARYGFLWRGTEHLNDRENGIVGGDWIVLDFQTQSVLAVARAFARYEVDKKMKDLLQFKYFACKNVDATKLSKRTLIPSAQRRSSMSPNNLLQATRDKLRAPEHER